MKINKCFSIIVCLLLAGVLTVMLVAGACAPAAPSDGDDGSAAEIAALKADITALEDDMNALEDDKNAEINDLEDELAALQTPAKIYRWEPATWAGAGTVWDAIVYMSDWIGKESNGRIVMTPSQPGAVVPVEEQIEAVGLGTTNAMVPTAAYYVGKIPAGFSISTPLVTRTLEETIDLFEYYEGGKFLDLYYGEVERLYNVENVGTVHFPSPTSIASNVPILSPADLKGVKFRCGDEAFAVPLTNLGASTVWFPGSEIYTGMATGVVDAFTYGSAYDYVSNSFHEVSQYWIKEPTCNATASIQFVVNRDVWNELSDDLQEMLKVAIDASTLRISVEALRSIEAAWATAEDAGIQIVVWSEEDQTVWPAEQLIWAQKYADDPIAGQQLQLMLDWAEAKGYL